MDEYARCENCKKELKDTEEWILGNFVLCRDCHRFADMIVDIVFDKINQRSL